MDEYFALSTGWSPERLDEVRAQTGAGTLAPVEAKRLLARTVVELYHGDGAGAAAEREFDQVFRAHATPSEIPEHVIDPADVRDGQIFLATVLRQAGLVTSNKEGRRQIAQGGVRRDGEVVDDEDVTFAPAQLDGATLQVGRRRWVRVRST